MCWRVGRMGSISDDGPGQHNPDRNEDPWGKAAMPLERWCTSAPRLSAQIGDTTLLAARCTKGGWQTARREEFAVCGKAPSDIPAFQPDWGKPTVRNDRGDDGNVSIIRSLVRAIVLPGNRTIEPTSEAWGALIQPHKNARFGGFCAVFDRLHWRRLRTINLT